PQILQRLCCRVENLGFLFDLAICDVLAIVSFALFAFRFSLFAFGSLRFNFNLFHKSFCIRARLQPCRYGPDKYRALAPEVTLSTAIQPCLTTHWQLTTAYCRNGIPMCFSNARAWSSLPAEVT